MRAFGKINDLDIIDTTRGQANGIASLDEYLRVPSSQVPSPVGTGFYTHRKSTEILPSWLEKLHSTEYADIGVTWTKKILDHILYTVAGDGNIFVLGTDTSLRWTTDFDSYTSCTLDGEAISSVCWQVTFAEGVWVAELSDIGVIWSMDGKAWHTASLPEGIIWGDTPFAIFYYKGIWSCSSTYAGVLYSLDGKSWQKGTIDYTPDDAHFMAIFVNAQGTRVAISFSGGLYRSTDGVHWHKSASSVTLTSPTQYSCVYFKDKWYIAIKASTKHFLVSEDDGLTWTTQSSYHYGECGMCVCNDVLVLGSSSNIYFSFDGQTFTPISSDWGLHSNVLALCGPIIIAFNYKSIMTSYDGINWQWRSTPSFTQNLNNIVFTSGMVFAWVRGLTSNVELLLSGTKVWMPEIVN